MEPRPSFRRSSRPSSRRSSAGRSVFSRAALPALLTLLVLTGQACAADPVVADEQPLHFDDRVAIHLVYTAHLGQPVGIERATIERLASEPRLDDHGRPVYSAASEQALARVALLSLGGPATVDPEPLLAHLDRLSRCSGFDPCEPVFVDPTVERFVVAQTLALHGFEDRVAETPPDFPALRDAWRRIPRAERTPDLLVERASAGVGTCDPDGRAALFFLGFVGSSDSSGLDVLRRAASEGCVEHRRTAIRSLALRAAFGADVPAETWSDLLAAETEPDLLSDLSIAAHALYGRDLILPVLDLLDTFACPATGEPTRRCAAAGALVSETVRTMQRLPNDGDGNDGDRDDSLRTIWRRLIFAQETPSTLFGAPLADADVDLMLDRLEAAPTIRLVPHLQVIDELAPWTLGGATRRLLLQLERGQDSSSGFRHASSLRDPGALPWVRFHIDQRTRGYHALWGTKASMDRIATFRSRFSATVHLGRTPEDTLRRRLRAFVAAEIASRTELTTQAELDAWLADPVAFPDTAAFPEPEIRWTEPGRRVEVRYPGADRAERWKLRSGCPWWTPVRDCGVDWTLVGRRVQWWPGGRDAR